MFYSHYLHAVAASKSHPFWHLHVLGSETSLLTSLCSKFPLSKSHVREVSWPCHSCQCPPWRHHALRATVSPDTLVPPWALRWPGFTLGEWPPPQCWHPDSQAGTTGSPRLETYFIKVTPSLLLSPSTDAWNTFCYQNQTNRNRWPCQSQVTNP